MPNGTTNPNAFGGAFNYDSRTGGFGSISNYPGTPTHPGSGIGRTWNGGDALSSPKGQWDDIEEPIDEKQFAITSATTVKELAYMAGLLDEEDYIELEAGIESKAHSSFHRGATDSLSRRGTSIGSLGGIGSDMSAVIGLSAGHELKGTVVTENLLKDLISEIVMLEYKGASGRIATMSAPKSKHMNSDPYKLDTTSASTNTADAAPLGHLPTSRSGINSKGYGGPRRKVVGLDGEEIPVTSDGSGVYERSSGEDRVFSKQDEEAEMFNKGYTSLEAILLNIESKE